MKTTFTFEPVAYLLSCGLHALGYRHWQEGVLDKVLFPYDPDWEEYARLEAQNVFRIIAVRHKGRLVGYAGIKIFNDMQSCKVVCGYIQEYYVEPEFRKGRTGIDLFRVIERHLAELKVNVLFVGDREFVLKDRGGLGRLFKYLGYRTGERLWMKGMACHPAS